MIHIEFFGGLKVHQTDNNLSIRGSNERALLAYFCAEGDRSYTRDYLATFFWPDSDPQKARQNLRAALFKLRQNLEITTGSPADALLTAGRENIQPHFQQNTDLFWSDVGQFRSLQAAINAHTHPNLQDCPVCRPRLEAAVNLYQGEFFHGIRGADSHAFEDWLCVTQESLRLQAIRYLKILAQHYADAAQFSMVIPIARQLVEIDPYHAAGMRYLLQALAQTNQNRIAQQEYERYRDDLQKNFGVEPAPELQDLYQRVRSRTTPIKKPPNPYLGLAAYTEQDANLFFGREAFLELLEAQLREHQFVVVTGDSGSGKSSVVQAGLIPQLRRQQPEDWAIINLRPGSNPQQALIEAFHQSDVPKLGPSNLTDGIDFKNLLCELLRETTVDHILLVIDQFEELFSLTTSPEERNQFIELLLSTQNCDPPTGYPLYVVLTLRADFLPQAIQHRGLADAIQTGALLLGPMNRDEMRRAISRPAAQRGVEFAPGLVSRLLDAVHTEPGSLVLLQFTLTRLWETMIGRFLTHSDYEAIGGLEDALAQYAEDVFASFSAAEQDQIKRIFLRLVRSLDNLPDTCRLAVRDEFANSEWQVIQQLANFRLITTREDPHKNPTIEIVHEALITHWDRLQTWLDENRAFRLWRSRLRFLHHLWLDHDRNPQLLLSGPALLEAEKWQLTHQDLLTTEEQNFIIQSLAHRDQEQTAREAEQQRKLEQAQALAEAEHQQVELQRKTSFRLRGMVIALVILLAVSLGLTALAFRQRQLTQREANVAYSLSLANRAQLALHEGDTGLALTLAMEANQIPDPPPQTGLMLAEAAYAPGVRRIFQGHTGSVEDFAVMPGTWDQALSASADGTLILWNLQTGEALRYFEGHAAAVHGVDLLPQGEAALSASADGTLILWNLQTGEIIRQFYGHNGAVWEVSIRPDCDLGSSCQAVSASEDGTLILWDVAQGELIRRFEGHNGAVYTVAISPNGSTALSGSADTRLILWNIEDGSILQTLQVGSGAENPSEQAPEINASKGHQGPVQDIVYGLDGRTAYSVSDDRQIIFWNLETGQAQRANSFDASILSLSLSPDGRYILLGRSDSQVILWAPYYGQVVLQLVGHTGRIQALRFSPDGRQALSASADGTLRLWDLRSGAEMRSLIYDGSALDVAINPAGDLLLLAGANGDIAVWDQAGGREIRRLVGHTESPFAGVLFRPAVDGDEPLIAISGAGNIFGAAQDNTLRLWNVESGEEAQRFEGHTDRLWDLDVSADGKFAVSASHDGTVRIWNLDQGTGEILADVSPQAARSVAFSPSSTPSGDTILVGLAKGTSTSPDFDLRQFDRETGELIQTFSGHTEIVSDVAFSPDGQTALSGSHDTLLILWNLESGQEIQRFEGHTGAVNKVVFSPDGHFALSAGLDNLIILWNVDRGLVLRIYRGHVGGVLGLAFAPDGNSFFSVAVDDSVRQWQLDTSLAELLAWVDANRYVEEITCGQKLQLGLILSCEGE